jgi:hypothetical protein
MADHFGSPIEEEGDTLMELVELSTPANPWPGDVATT